MVTAVYVHSAPTMADHALIRRAVEGSEVISNVQLQVPHTLYMMGEQAGRIYGKATKAIQKTDYPFDWMHPMARRLALLIAMAKDSDRIVLLFSERAPVADVFVLVAMAYNNTVRVFRGGVPCQMKTFPDAERQYK